MAKDVEKMGYSDPTTKYKAIRFLLLFFSGNSLLD